MMHYEAISVTRRPTVQELYAMSSNRHQLISNTYLYPGYERLEMNQLFLIVAKVLKFISLQLLIMTSSNVNIVVHDGPGPLSPSLDVKQVIDFTGSLGFVSATVPYLSTVH